MKHYLYWLALIAVVIIVVILLSNQDNSDNRPLIVTTATPTSLIVENLAGDDFQIRQLVPNGQEVHDFQPTPTTVSDLTQASLLIEIGAGLEDDWLDNLTKNQDFLKQVNLAELAQQQNIELIDGEDGDQTHGGTNPHIWLSPRLVAKVLPGLGEELAKVNPSRRLQIESRVKSFLGQLMNLDQVIQSEVTNFHTNKFIASHEAFDYFARDYGLTQVASLAATPGEVLTPGSLQEISGLVKENNLKGIFVEPGFGEQLSKQLTKDLGIELKILNPLEIRPNDESYIQLMESNLTNLKSLMGE